MGRAVPSEVLRKRSQKKRYSLSPEAFDQMVRDQNGVCAICRTKPETGKGRWSKFVVDHCHQTKSNRGLLCVECNLALGAFGDSEAKLGMAIAYLRSHTEAFDA